MELFLHDTTQLHTQKTQNAVTFAAQQTIHIYLTTALFQVILLSSYPIQLFVMKALQLTMVPKGIAREA